ncbi:conserved hypothetical protein [Hyphomicrobiales bacterium]|nr:conserved hypothetical protein [Hyphomicrobiales bacterium]CAH1702570.1 conserved hypothetical protein [Hyphomicrobiales bacterium]CAI0346773.1 conserved hypothetical protein [Hyphomicrobiales bacterium]
MTTQRSEAVRQLDDLKKRHDALRTRAIRNQADKERAESELAEAEKSAIEQFGTADVAALVKMADDIRADNALKLQSFGEAIAAAETNLVALENQPA